MSFEQPSTIESEDKSPLNFHKDSATLLLSIENQESALKALENIAKEAGLSKKEEFHITLIGAKTGVAILRKLKSLSAEEKEKTLLSIKDLAKSFKWSHDSAPEYYFISKHYATTGQPEETRRSIIQIVALPDLVPFYEALNKLLGTNFEAPLPHTTLFSTSTLEASKLRGIGIYSAGDLKNLNPEKIELPT